MNEITSVFEKMYKSFVESNYYLILSMVKNHDVALKIAEASFETIIYNQSNQSLNKVAQSLCRKYVNTHKEVASISINDIEMDIPKFVYDLFSFKTYLYYNEIDNLIIIYKIHFDMTFKQIANLLNLSLEHVITTYNQIIQKMIYEYKQKIANINK